MRLTVTTKLLIGFFAISLLVVLVGAFSYRITQEIVYTFRGSEEHFRSVVTEATEAAIQIKEAESQLMLYVILGDEGRRGEFQRRKEAFEQRMVFLHLASLAPGTVVPYRGIAREMDVPEDFLAKILKTLVDQGLVRSTRGPHGGYALARPPASISFLDVIEAVEGPVALNVRLDGEDACGHSTQCTMASVWRLGQERMLDVYREKRLADLAFKPDEDGQIGLVQLQMRDAQARPV